uniref:Uncharacterized protein n=1 Tax=Cannabis sativa TaxID=3483 RepID=A0A803PMB1_CANSA
MTMSDVGESAGGKKGKILSSMTFSAREVELACLNIRNKLVKVEASEHGQDTSNTFRFLFDNGANCQGLKDGVSSPVPASGVDVLPPRVALVVHSCALIPRHSQTLKRWGTVSDRRVWRPKVTESTGKVFANTSVDSLSTPLEVGKKPDHIPIVKPNPNFHGEGGIIGRDDVNYLVDSVNLEGTTGSQAAPTYFFLCGPNSKNCVFGPDAETCVSPCHEKGPRLSKDVLDVGPRRNLNGSALCGSYFLQELKHFGGLDLYEIHEIGDHSSFFTSTPVSITTFPWDTSNQDLDSKVALEESSNDNSNSIGCLDTPFKGVPTIEMLSWLNRWLALFRLMIFGVLSMRPTKEKNFIGSKRPGSLG